MIPEGFRFAATGAGIKSAASTRLDLGLIYCTRRATLSGVFTRNRIKAAPVLIGMQQVKRGTLRAVLANSGNANACTGQTGIEDAQALMAAVAAALGQGITADEVLPLSTGVIGMRLPLERMLPSVPTLVGNLGEDAKGFADAIMTTDTYPKIVCRQAGSSRIMGIAKGSGMIAPDMATTLAVILTDARVPKEHLDNLVHLAVEDTVNAITVDGDTSTNDTLIAVSSALVDVDLALFDAAMHAVIRELALLVVKDGEGATKCIEIRVTGACSDREARQVAMTVANSPLVKTAFFGGDPNWGRIIAAAGRSGVEIVPGSIDLGIAGMKVVSAGEPTLHFDEHTLNNALQGKDILVEMTLGEGPGSFTVWTTDLSYKYIEINADYRT